MLSALLVQLCELYNICLEQRIAHYKQGKRTGYYDQQAELKELRAGCPEYAVMPVAIQRAPLRRLQRAFDAFFRRLQIRR
jgi:putative transposase